ncbi:hypothetical protein DQG23_15110 [Paenibacillus contaminans]|uniref:HTH araC/xylS-type domain-containing protein n=2 Tax=Paenibacillus contaminans TaxID=450362 RepID=A0A329MKH6_9BACL|nr:hypothetical protein DQG23_15110 [Paenibacillus contaminans]
MESFARKGGMAKITAASIVAAVLAVTSACSGAKPQQELNESAGKEQEQTVKQEGQGAKQEGPSGKDLYFGKFDPPVKMTTGRDTSSMKFDEGKSIDDNAYEDMSYFGRFFKKHAGMTPGEFKEAAKNGPI